jgi:hypothetical protein
VFLIQEIWLQLLKKDLALGFNKVCEFDVMVVVESWTPIDSQAEILALHQNRMRWITKSENIASLTNIKTQSGFYRGTSVE